MASVDTEQSTTEKTVIEVTETFLKQAIEEYDSLDSRAERLLTILIGATGIVPFLTALASFAGVGTTNDTEVEGTAVSEAVMVADSLAGEPLIRIGILFFAIGMIYVLISYTTGVTPGHPTSDAIIKLEEGTIDHFNFNIRRIDRLCSAILIKSFYIVSAYLFLIFATMLLSAGLLDHYEIHEIQEDALRAPFIIIFLLFSFSIAPNFSKIINTSPLHDHAPSKGDSIIVIISEIRLGMEQILIETCTLSIFFALLPLAITTSLIIAYPSFHFYWLLILVCMTLPLLVIIFVSFAYVYHRIEGFDGEVEGS